MLIENQAAMETRGVWSFGNAVGRRCGEGEERLCKIPHLLFLGPRGRGRVGGLAIFLSFCASVSVSGNLRSPFGSTWWWGGLKGDPSVSQWPEPVCVLHWKESQTSQCLWLSSQGGALLPRFPKQCTLEKPWEKTEAVKSIW